MDVRFEVHTGRRCGRDQGLGRYRYERPLFVSTFQETSMFIQTTGLVPTLPQEVIDVVIDHLVDCPSSLKACSLVCSSWTYFSQAQLFSTILLDGTPYPSAKTVPPIVKFTRFLRKAPRFARFVRALEIKDGDDYITNRWLLDSVGRLESLLPVLTNVHTLHINFRSLSWSAAHIVKRPLREMLQHPELRHVTISGIMGIPSLDHLFSLFGKGSKIRDLHLVNVQTNGPSDESRLPLDVLTLSLSSTDILNLADWVPFSTRVADFSGLRRLRICIVEPSEVRAAARLLETITADSLESVEIQLDDLDPTDSRQCGNLPDISRFRHVLLTITSGCVENTIRREGRTSAPVAALWWARILRNIQDGCVEEVTLTFPRSEAYPLPDIHKAQWNALDAVLTRPEMAKLKTVYLQGDLQHLQKQAKVIRQAFPTLQKNGLLVLQSQ
ncbi:hypothetical protein BDZ89DRAFT_1079101 [Hymenopellis radicata]|nr:hypothetical protein BDZ89DRAFT_1079101 [Hymenopellis radicata]